jgi:hypothetical protein
MTIDSELKLMCEKWWETEDSKIRRKYVIDYSGKLPFYLEIQMLKELNEAQVKLQKILIACQKFAINHDLEVDQISNLLQRQLI